MTRKGIEKVSGLSQKRRYKSGFSLTWLMFKYMCSMYHNIKKNNQVMLWLFSQACQTTYKPRNFF